MANKINILLALLVALSVRSYCQVAVYESPKEQMDLEISDGDSVTTHRLFRLSLDNDNYILESVPETVFSYDSRFNSTDTIVLSFGKYVKQENELQMVDSLSGFSMLAVYDAEGSLQFRQGLAVTMGKTFFLQRTIGVHEVKSRFPKVIIHKLDYEKFRNQEMKPLKPGFYTSGFKKFELKEDGSYVYCNGFPIDTLSVGRWSQEGNLLVFQDKGLKEPFYACIEDRRWKIIGNTMPGSVINGRLDGSYLFSGYDDSGPTKMDMAKPMMGEDFLNVSFDSELDENQLVEIYFYENEFSVDQILFNDDIIFVHTISYGTYYKEGYMLHLCDSLIGYKMVFELSSDSTKITLLQGFCPLKGNSFDFVDQTWHRPEHACFFDFDEVNYPFEDYRKQKNLNHCPTGSYQFQIHGNFPHELVLTDDNRFSYKIMDVLLLHGVATREGNLLILKDDCIEEPFFVLIEKDGLVPNLPGLFGKWKSIDANH